MPASPRLLKLQEMLQRTPDDPFLVYCLAMEHRKAGETATAVEFFDRVTQLDPAYCAAYHMKGQTLEAAGDLPAARRAYADGITAAARKGDDHAKEEMSAALAAIEDL
jgi:predicted Zn-dependent protease